MTTYIVAGLLAWSALMWLAILLIRVNRLRDDVDLLQAQVRKLRREQEQSITASASVPSCWTNSTGDAPITFTTGNTWSVAPDSFIVTGQP